MLIQYEYTFGYHTKSGEVWFHVRRIYGNDYMHDYYWQPTLGM